MSNAARSTELGELVARTRGLQPWRRLIHLVAGSGMAGLVYVLSPHAPSTRWLFGCALAVTFLIDVLRLRLESLNRAFFRTFSALACPREAERLSLTWFLLGVFSVLWFPGDSIAVASILVLSVADPAASVVGRVWGTHALGKGTVEGTTAFYFTAAAVLAPLVGLSAALPAAAIAAAAEVGSARLDDNAVVPVATAVSLWALSFLS